jgi:putative transposase
VKDVVAVLEAIKAERDLPQVIKVDNGSEFISKAMDRWAYENGVELRFLAPRETDRQRQGGILQRAAA